VGGSGSDGVGGAIASNASSALLDPVAQGELQYGLLGLLGVIRMENENVSKLALGMDLTTLGLNLNSSDLLHRDMVSPFEEGRPAYVPACYAPPPVGTGPQLSLQQEHFGRYHLETLFYIFYAMPHDAMQVRWVGLVCLVICLVRWFIGVLRVPSSCATTTRHEVFCTAE
jgi:hypothetical protein